MTRHRRGFQAFSLSFIDCMSCGLGAVILLFMIINHASEVRAKDQAREVAPELGRLESEVLASRAELASLRDELDASAAATKAAEQRAQALAAGLEQSDDNSDAARAGRERIAVLQQELQTIDARVKKLRAQAESDNATRSFQGEGNRQYLTGLKVGGERILILLDASASMLDTRIVNIIRRRNMPAARQRSAPKWRQAVAAVDWLTTQVPASARFQLYVFNNELRPALEGTLKQWQATDGGTRLTAAVRALDELVPAGGTSLQKAFAAAAQLSPKPDNVYLVTDSLPTQGVAKRGGTVSGEQRLDYYREAVAALPRGVPVNVILMPMEGDPFAASAFWQLAQVSGGSFVAPAEDWP